MENSAPFEIMAAPFELWLAPVGTSYPAVDAVPSGSWTKIGTSGSRNVSEDGVTIALDQAFEGFRGLSSLGKIKMFRKSEDASFDLKLADMTLEQFATVMEYPALVTINATMGVAGTKKLGLSRGRTVTPKALLVRGPSPYMDNGVAQFEVPISVQTASQKIDGKKDTPAMLALTFEALEDPNAISEDERFGRFIAQTADALT